MKASVNRRSQAHSRLRLAICVLLILSVVLHVSGSDTKPNIIFIMADDLGYGDLGAFGQGKIRTPNLDRMASEGMRLTQHYSGSPVCAPSRCVLMTGKHPGHAWVRNNREVKPEGQPPIPDAEVTVAELLKQEGYATAVVGKWGLGFPGSEGDPLNQGFDFFFGYNCQRHAHNYYPEYLWRNRDRVSLNNPAFAAHQELPPDITPEDTSRYPKYSGADYAPDLILKEALGFVRNQKDKPFFLYYASPVPHLALQVPEDSLSEYEGDWPEKPYPGGRGYLPHPSPRAAYAAMVTRLDRDIGQLMALIEELGLEKKTVFVFTSDNGPLYNGHGGTDTEFFNSANGLRGRKGSLYEGGIRVPTIVRWAGKIKPGTTSDWMSGFEDWMPTLLELTGQNGSVPSNIDGVSFAPVLLGREQAPRDFLYREFAGYGGWQSVRSGPWKAVRQNLNQKGKVPAVKTELYNLKNDPAESSDVAAEHPRVLKRLEQIMQQEHEPSELFPMRALDEVEVQ